MGKNNQQRPRGKPHKPPPRPVKKPARQKPQPDKGKCRSSCVCIHTPGKPADQVSDRPKRCLADALVPSVLWCVASRSATAHCFLEGIFSTQAQAMRVVHAWPQHLVSGWTVFVLPLTLPQLLHAELDTLIYNRFANLYHPACVPSDLKLFLEPYPYPLPDGGDVDVDVDDGGGSIDAEPMDHGANPWSGRQPGEDGRHV